MSRFDYEGVVNLFGENDSHSGEVARAIENAQNGKAHESFKALHSTDPDICKVCGTRIRVQVFRGTGACGVIHDKIMRGKTPDGWTRVSVGLLRRHVGKEVRFTHQDPIVHLQGRLSGYSRSTYSTVFMHLEVVIDGMLRGFDMGLDEAVEVK